MDPSRKKGILVGYNDQSKYYRVYILRYHQIEIHRDITFDEDVDFKKYRNKYVVEYHEEENAVPKIVDISRLLVQDVEEQSIPEYHDIAEPQRPMEPPHEMISWKIIPSWDHDLIKYENKYGALEGRKRLRPY